MKTLLVPVAMHDALTSVFETTRLAASRFGSLIEGVSLRPALAEYVPVDMVGGMTWLRDEEADRAEAEEAGGRFVAFMDAAGIPRHARDGLCIPEKVADAGPRYRWRQDVPTGDAFLGPVRPAVLGHRGRTPGDHRQRAAHDHLRDRPVRGRPADPAGAAGRPRRARRGDPDRLERLHRDRPGGGLRDAVPAPGRAGAGAQRRGRHGAGAERTGPRPGARLRGRGRRRTGPCRPAGARPARPSWPRPRPSAATC